MSLSLRDNIFGLIYLCKYLHIPLKYVFNAFKVVIDAHITIQAK